MDRQELTERINSIPNYSKRDVKIKTQNESGEFVEVTQKAIAEDGTDTAIVFVGKNYSVVQFKDIFQPMLDSVEGNVDGYIYWYGGFAMMKLFPEMDELKDGETRYGLVAMNSIDLSSSVIIKFCVKHNGYMISIPPGVGGLKRQHSGNIGTVTHDYINMIGGVKAAWNQIVTEFPKYTIVKDSELSGVDNGIEFKTIIEKLKLGKRLSEKLKEDFDKALTMGRTYTLWDAFIKILYEVSNQEYKSGVHKEKHIDNLCEAVFDYAMALSL
jgi:hypothetical protein